MRKISIATMLATLAVAGAAYAIPIGGTTSNEIMPGTYHHFYGGMKIFENADAYPINTASSWHLIYTAGDWATGLVNGMTYQDGATDAVSGDYANAGGGKVTVTAASHPFSAGEFVSISGTTSYNTVYEVESPVTADTFTVTATFVDDGTVGTVDRSGNITIINAGTYKVVYHISEAPSANNDIFDFVLYKNATAIDASESRHESKTAGKYSTVAGCDIVSVAAGDVISVGVKNISSADDIIIRYAHISIFQL